MLTTSVSVPVALLLLLAGWLGAGLLAAVAAVVLEARAGGLRRAREWRDGAEVLYFVVVGGPVSLVVVVKALLQQRRR